MTDTETTATETKSPRELAEAYLASEINPGINESSSETEVSDATVETTEEQPKPPVVDEKKKELEELREERRKASEALAKARGQFEALERVKAKVKESGEKHAASLKEFDSVFDSPETMVRYYAKRKGIDPHDVWTDIAEQLRNGGKRSPESETKREIAELRREREEEKRQAAEREAQAKADADEREAQLRSQNAAKGIENIKTQSVELVAKSPELYPTLQSYPRKALGTMVLELMDTWAENVKQQVGRYPNSNEVPPLDDFLAYLEKQEAEEQPVAKQLAPKARPRIPNNDTSSSVDGERKLSMEERRELARQALDRNEL